jgi:hypothetical protein
MNPLPYSNAQAAPEFPPPCNETVDRKLTDTPSCSGRDPFNTLIVDRVLVPASVKPGEYVLGIRWWVGGSCKLLHDDWLPCRVCAIERCFPVCRLCCCRSSHDSQC